MSLYFPGKYFVLHVFTANASIKGQECKRKLKNKNVEA